MGKMWACRDAGQSSELKIGFAVPLAWRVSWVPIYHNVSWAKAYLHTSCLAIIDMGRKMGTIFLIAQKFRDTTAPDNKRYR